MRRQPRLFCNPNNILFNLIIETQLVYVSVSKLQTWNFRSKVKEIEKTWTVSFSNQVIVGNKGFSRTLVFKNEMNEKRKTSIRAYLFVLTFN